MRHAGLFVFVAPSAAAGARVAPAPTLVTDDAEPQRAPDDDPERRFVEALLRVRAAGRRRAANADPAAHDAP